MIVMMMSVLRIYFKFILLFSIKLMIGFASLGSTTHALSICFHQQLGKTIIVIVDI